MWNEGVGETKVSERFFFFCLFPKKLRSLYYKRFYQFFGYIWVFLKKTHSIAFFSSFFLLHCPLSLVTRGISFSSLWSIEYDGFDILSHRTIFYFYTPPPPPPSRKGIFVSCKSRTFFAFPGSTNQYSSISSINFQKTMCTNSPVGTLV